MTLHTDDGVIQCWIGGPSNVVCRIFVAEKINSGK